MAPCRGILQFPALTLARQVEAVLKVVWQLPDCNPIEAGLPRHLQYQLFTPSGCPVAVPPAHPVADHVLTTFEGAFVLSKLMGEPKLASQQLIQCRNYLELLFTPGSV